MTTVPLIANPAAGGGRCGQRLDAAVARLRDGGLDVEVHRTRGPGHATELARQVWASGARRLLCAGGDGTTYEVLNGLFPLDRGDVRPTLGILPLGTGNSFLRDLHLEDADAAMAAVLAGRRVPADVVRADHEDGRLYYANLLTVGFTSDVGHTTNRFFKPLGAAGYAVATVVEVARLGARPFPHRLDDGPLDTAPYAFLSFSNSRCTGGTMQMAPDADLADGRVDVIRVGPMGRLDLLRTFPKIYEGTHLAHPRVSSATAHTVHFALDAPVTVMLDGEVATLTLRGLEVLHHAVEVLA